VFGHTSEVMPSGDEKPPEGIDRLYATLYLNPLQINCSAMPHCVRWCVP